MQRGQSCVHIEARHTMVPEQLAVDLAGTIARTGALIHETISAALVLSPEHVRLFAAAGWSKADVRQAVYEGRPRLARARGGGQGRGVQPDPAAAWGSSGCAACLWYC